MSKSAVVGVSQDVIDIHRAEGEGMPPLEPTITEAEKDGIISELADKIARNKITVDEARELMSDMIGDVINRKQAAIATVPFEDEPVDPDTVLVDVLENGDYVQKRVTKQELVSIREGQNAQVIDPFALGDEYQQGDAARFDYYFGDGANVGMLQAKQRGWVPVRRSLDGQHDDSEGIVHLNEMVLMRRPKALRAVYEKQDKQRAESMMGKPLDDLKGEASNNSKYIKVDEDGGSGVRIEEREGSYNPSSKDRGPSQSPEELQDRLKVAASGKKSFLIDRNPIYDEKVRNARAALGAG